MTVIGYRRQAIVQLSLRPNPRPATHLTNATRLHPRLNPMTLTVEAYPSISPYCSSLRVCFRSSREYCSSSRNRACINSSPLNSTLRSKLGNLFISAQYSSYDASSTGKNFHFTRTSVTALSLMFAIFLSRMSSGSRICSTKSVGF